MASELRASRARSLAGVLLLAGVAPIAHADMLYKCLDAAGQTTIQNDPCPKGQTRVWARDTTPEPPPSPEQVALEQARREQAALEAAERAAAEEAAAKQAAEADAIKREFDARERAQARAAAKREGVTDSDAADAPPRDAEEGNDVASKEERCNAAKAFAQSLRDKPWIDLDDAQWRRVYGWVFQQCRK